MSTPSEPRRSARNVGKPAPPPVVKRPSGKRAAPVDEEEVESSKKTKAEGEAKAEGPADAAAEVEPVAPAAAAASSKALELGDVLPAGITLQNEKGDDVEVSKLTGEKGVVFFTYPKAATPGCTAQACLYRDVKSAFSELGYDVYGLSKDKPAAQQSWINKQGLTYSCLSDPSSKLIKALGAFAAPSSTKRSHFIFEKGTGKLIDKDVGVKPATDSSNALDFLKKHHA